MFANLKTLGCGTKDPNCRKRRTELVQSQAVDENCHKRTCLLIQVIYLLRLKKLFMCLHIVVTVWQYSSFKYCDWNPDSIFWLVSKCEVSNRNYYIQGADTTFDMAQDWYFIQNDSISTYSLLNAHTYNFSYYSLCIY